MHIPSVLHDLCNIGIVLLTITLIITSFYIVLVTNNIILSLPHNVRGWKSTLVTYLNLVLYKFQFNPQWFRMKNHDISFHHALIIPFQHYKGKYNYMTQTNILLYHRCTSTTHRCPTISEMHSFILRWITIYGSNEHMCIQATNTLLESIL